MEHIILHETAKLAKLAGFERVTHLSYDGVGSLMHQPWNKFAVHPSYSPCCYQGELKNWLFFEKNIFIELKFANNHWSAYFGEFTMPEFIPDGEIHMEEQESLKRSIEAYHSIVEEAMVAALKTLIK